MSYTSIINNSRSFNKDITLSSSPAFNSAIFDVILEMGFKLKETKTYGAYKHYIYKINDSFSLTMYFIPHQEGKIKEDKVFFYESNRNYSLSIQYINVNNFTLALYHHINSTMTELLEEELNFSTHQAFNNLFQFIRADYSDDEFSLSKEFL